MTYNHTQRGYWHYLLFAIALGLFGGAVGLRESHVTIVLAASAAVLGFCGLAFASLTVRDDGDCLAVRFGPLPLLGKRIRYADISSVEIGRTSIIDGWGVHYVLGRGWSWNIWGFACVKLKLGRKVIRIGTDDADELVKVIREKTGLNTPAA